MSPHLQNLDGTELTWPELHQRLADWYDRHPQGYDPEVMRLAVLRGRLEQLIRQADAIIASASFTPPHDDQHHENREAE